MKVFYTKLIVASFGGIRSISGPEVYALNVPHARLALAHMGISNYSILFYEELVRPPSIVEWDSLLYPSELQLN